MVLRELVKFTTEARRESNILSRLIRNYRRAKSGKYLLLRFFVSPCSVVQQSKGKRSAAVPYANEYRHAKDAKIDARKRVQKNYSTPPLFELCELTLW